MYDMLKTSKLQPFAQEGGGGRTRRRAQENSFLDATHTLRCLFMQEVCFRRRKIRH